MDWYCRNCKFRFVPTFWVPAGYGMSLVGHCPRCHSNATELVKDTSITYTAPKNTEESQHEIKTLRDTTPPALFHGNYY